MWEKGNDRICRNAPHLILASGLRKAPFQSDHIIAITYLELAAHSQGLGACWAGYFNLAAAGYPPLIKALEIPDDCRILGSMMIGYPVYKYYRVPMRKNLR